MTLQEMHEAVAAKRGPSAGAPMFRLFQKNRSEWAAGWSAAPYARAATAQEAIDAAFKLAMENRP